MHHGITFLFSRRLIFKLSKLLLVFNFFLGKYTSCVESESDFLFPLNWCEVKFTTTDPDATEFQLTLTVVPFQGPSLTFFQKEVFVFPPPMGAIVNFDFRPLADNPYVVTVSYPSMNGIKVVGWLAGLSGDIQSWSHFIER